MPKVTENLLTSVKNFVILTCMNSLPPPSPPASNGILVNGTLLPFNPATIELMLKLNAAIAATEWNHKALKDAIANGETDTMSFAQDYRASCTDETVALEELRTHLAKGL